MATFSKQKLSGSTNGRGIKVVRTATAGTDIHDAHASDLDEVWLWAYNSHTAPVVLTIEMGGTTDPDDHIVMTLPFDSGAITIVPGLLMSGSLGVAAFASVTNVVVIYGFVNRITA
jgi:hypothetical protein